MQRVSGFYAEDLPSSLNSLEDSIAIGEAAYVTLVSTNGITMSEVDALDAKLAENGFHLVDKIAIINKGDLCALSIPLRKGSPQWALLVPLIPVLFIGGLIAFSIVKIGDITRAILPVIIAVGVFGIAAIWMIRQPATEYIRKM